MKHSYTLDGTKILREVWESNTLIPLYDNEDSVCGIIYNDVPYYFQKNLQGDIIGIVDKDAKVVVRYSYDAWGKCSVIQDISNCGIAAINPYRYRGYYFDVEIGMYYLQSRYYDPSVGCFVNADEAIMVAVNSHSLYMYCKNSPVAKADRTGFCCEDITESYIQNTFSESWLYDLAKLFNVKVERPYKFYPVKMKGFEIRLSIGLGKTIGGTGAITISSGGISTGYGNYTLGFGLSQTTVGFEFSIGAYTYSIYARHTWLDSWFGGSITYSPKGSGPYVSLTFEWTYNHIYTLIAKAKIAAIVINPAVAVPSTASYGVKQLLKTIIETLVKQGVGVYA